MNSESFFVEFVYKSKTEFAEIKPCCQEDNVYYYDVSIKNQYQFTVTPNIDEKTGLSWKISFKNADKQFDPELIRIIGDEIEKHLFTQ